MTLQEVLLIAASVAVAFLSLGMMLGEDRGVRVVECQQAGFGAPSWLAGACTVSLEGGR